jgi:hypothetical protein
MTRIDQSSQLAALIRAQLQAQRQTSAKHVKQTKTLVPKNTGMQPARDSWIVDSSLIEEIRQLSPSDSHRKRKAFVLFLQKTLYQQLGNMETSLIEVKKLAADVLLEMESDTELAEMIDQASEALIAAVES